MSTLFVIKVGNNDFPATNDDLLAIEKAATEVFTDKSKLRVWVTHHAIQVEKHELPQAGQETDTVRVVGMSSE